MGSAVELVGTSSEGQSRHGVPVSCEGVQVLAALGLPYQNELAPVSRGEVLAIRGDGHAQDVAAVA